MEDLEKIIDNYNPEAVEVEPFDSTLGWSVLVKDKNSDFQAWVDVSVNEKYKDVETEWNQYIFYTDDSSDVLQQKLQDNDMIFDYCTSEAIQKLQDEGLIYQDEHANWFYTDKAKEEAKKMGIEEEYKVKRNKLKEAVSEVIDMKTFLDKFDAEYDFLYDHEDNVAGYEEAVEAFDMDMKNPKFKKFVQDFVKYRGDVVSSDREAASFEFACESLGLFNQLLEHKGVSMRKRLGRYSKLHEETALLTPPPLNVVDGGATTQEEQPKKKDGRSFIYYIKAKAKNNQIDWENAYKDENDGYRWFLPLKYHHNAERVARAIKDNFRRGKLDVNVKILPMPDDVDKPRYVELNFRNKKKERENPDEYKWVQESISKLNEELSKYLG